MKEKTILGSEIYSKYSNEILLKAYAEGPQRIRQAIQGLSEEDLKAKLIPGKWSIAEIIVHLADGDIIGACRMRQAYTDHEGPFPYYLEASWAERLNYQNRDPVSIIDNLNLLDLLRKTTGTILNYCINSDWAKKGLHPQRGEMTLRGLLELYADHTERHLVHILERRALLGKPLEMELILEDRLY